VTLVLHTEFHRLIHGYPPSAHCQACDWRSDDVRHARAQAVDHSARTQHVVAVEFDDTQTLVGPS
jgi:hypothetical protein